MPRFLFYGLFVVGLLRAQSGWAQGYFNRRYHISSSPTGFSGATQVVADGTGYWMGGACNSGLVSGERALFLQHLDATGQPDASAHRWARPGVNYYSGEGENLFRTADGGLQWVGGVTERNTAYAMVWRLDTQGDTLWTRRFMAAGQNVIVPRGACQTADGGLFIVGEFHASFTTYASRLLLLRLDAAGNEVWRHTLLHHYFASGQFCRPTADGGFLISGYWLGSFPQIGTPFNTNIVVLKVDSLGQEQWRTSFGGPYTDASGPMLPTADGGYVMAGSWSTRHYTDAVNTYSQAMPSLFWFDGAGTLLLRRSYGAGHYNTAAFSLYALPTGGYILGGQSSTPLNAIPVGNGFPTGLAVRVCEDGDSVWYREYQHLTGGRSQNYMRQLVPTADGGFVGAGFLWTQAPDVGTNDAWLFKLDSAGYLQAGGAAPGRVCPRPVGLGEVEGALGVDVWPNPSADGRFVVRVAGELEVRGTFVVLDALGRVVTSGALRGGETMVDLSRQPPGVYVLRVVGASGSVVTRKLVR